MSDLSSPIITRREAGVGTVTINRRERFNSLDIRTAQDLRRAALALARDDEIRVVVLRGSGGVFCSGADLKYIHEGGNQLDLDYLRPESTEPHTTGFGEIFKQILEYLHSTISEIRRAPKPVIAAVDGMAAAGGFGLAMACDLVFASARSSFEWAYGKTGLTGAESSTFLLPRLVGFRRAMELMLLNPRLDAWRAMDLGLVTAVWAVEEFEQELAGVAGHLAQGPTKAYGIAKGLLNQAAGIDRLDFHLDLEIEELSRIANGGDFAEGLASFIGKRAPNFTGRD